MSPAATATVPKVAFTADLKTLTEIERAIYYQDVCESLGLNPLTRPLEYISLNGKLTLYAKKDCTDQLRKIHSVSITQLTNSVIEGLIIFTAHAVDGRGRLDVATGAASIEGLKGETRANAIMKAETKAKRRVTLSLCGMGLLDETEVEPEATYVPVIEPQAAPEPATFLPVSEAPAEEKGERREPPKNADDRRPTPSELTDIKNRVAKTRATLEDAGLQPSAGATTGTKLVRYFTKVSGAGPKEMTIGQWSSAFTTLNALLEKNVKEAVKTVEEAVAA